MAKVLTCDCCGKPTDQIIIKMFKAPKHSKTDHSHYTHHADVGICCINTMNKINWQPRIKREKSEAPKAA